MKNILYCLFIVLISQSCQEVKQNNAAFTDFENNPDYPAFNEEMIFTIAGDTVAGYGFIANGKALKETIILAHGFPGNDNNFDVAQAIRRTGKNVIHFNYRGSWGSQGNYLYTNGLDDIDGIIKYLSIPENAKRLRIRTDDFTLLGRSYGGGIALIQGSKNEQVKKIIAVSSANYGDRLAPYTTLDDLVAYKKYMAKQIMINVDINTFLQEMLDNKDRFNVVTYKDLLKEKKVLIIEDSDRNMNWISQLENIELVNIESGHNFIDKRIKMTNTIINWLNNN